MAGAFLLLALARSVPRPTRPVPPPNRPPLAGSPTSPGDTGIGPSSDGTGTLSAGTSAGGNPEGDDLIGPGLRADMDAVVGAWEELRPAMPRPNSWQARATANIVANLLVDAAHQDRMWTGKPSDATRPQSQVRAFLEEHARTRAHDAPAPRNSP